MERLHWYLITTSSGNEKCSMYKGVKNNSLTIANLDNAKEVNGHPNSAIVDGVFYLGHMTRHELEND